MAGELLHFESVGKPDASTAAFLLHGILGSGRNFRGFARRLAERCPHVQFLLPDLRHHGASPKPAGPHTMERVAEDVAELARSLGIERAALIGHSFGGKAAMVLARDAPELCQRLFVLDSNPGFQHVSFDDPREHEVLYVLHHLRQRPGPFADKNEAARTLIEAGLSERIARWIVLNLDGPAGALRWHFDLDAIEEMLSAYFESNLWPLLEGPSTFPKCVVIGGRSDRHSTGNRERLESSARSGNIELHVLENAGHWLHVDDPEGLLGVLAPRL